MGSIRNEYGTFLAVFPEAIQNYWRNWMHPASTNH